MHSLASISIRNFRSCGDTNLRISAFTPLVGVNNGGKSNILAAINWLLKPWGLVDADFRDPAQPVVMEGHITEVTPELLALLGDEHQRRISPFCSGTSLAIRRTQQLPGSSVKSVVLEIRDPTVPDPGSPDAWRKNPTGIDAAIKELFPEPIEIGAMEDAASDVSASKSGSTIGKLISELTDPIEAHYGAAVRDSLSTVRRRFDAQGDERAPELTELEAQANEKLRDFFPGVTIRIHVPLPELKELFKGGTIRVFEGEGDSGRDVTALGHGTQRSIQMALVRHLGDMKMGGEVRSRRTLLLIDEPELYLHPQAVEQVRSALDALSGGPYQVVFATHSPLMIGPDHISHTLIVRKTIDHGTFVQPTLAEAIAQVIEDAPSQAQALLELNNSSQILFCDKAVVAEGTTEQRLLPEVYCLLRHQTLGAARIALVTAGGVGGIAKCMQILNAMRIPTLGLADLDFAFRTAQAAGLLRTDDPDIEQFRRCASSLSARLGFTLANDGFPCSNNAMSAKDAFSLIARDPQAAPCAASLHAKLLQHSIWLWTEGAFDQYLGLRSTKEEAIIEYRRRLRSEGCEATIPGLATIEEFFRWLDHG